MTRAILVTAFLVLNSTFASADQQTINCSSKDVVAALITDCTVRYGSNVTAWGYFATRNIQILMCDGQVKDMPERHERASFFPVNERVTEAEAQHNAALSCSSPRLLKSDEKH